MSKKYICDDPYLLLAHARSADIELWRRTDHRAFGILHHRNLSRCHKRRTEYYKCGSE